jgi:hypothetical protein
MFKKYIIGISIFIILFNLLFGPSYKHNRGNDIYIDEPTDLEQFNL